MDCKSETDDKARDIQLERSKEAAHARECYEDEAAFDVKLQGIAEQKPEDAVSKSGR